MHPCRERECRRFSIAKIVSIFILFLTFKRAILTRLEALDHDQFNSAMTTSTFGSAVTSGAGDRLQLKSSRLPLLAQQSSVNFFVKR